jgi:hypothetical protein
VRVATIRAGTPLENGVADVTGCSEIGVVPFSDAYIAKWSKISSSCILNYKHVTLAICMLNKILPFAYI